MQNPHLQPNTTLQGGKHRIERVLGQGGFGIVLIVSLFVMFPVLAVAQASGGQIRRSPKQIMTQQRASKPTTKRKLSKNEALLEDGKTIVKFETTRAVDLGLPSGTIWAGWNIDADSPTEIGGFYAWGETKTRDYYFWEDYFDTKSYLAGENNYRDKVTFMEFGGKNLKRSIIGTNRDVARVKWGEPWKMPSREQMQELLNSCSIHIVTIPNYFDTIFSLFTGPNGKSILVPLAGEFRRNKYIEPLNSSELFYSGELQKEEYNERGEYAITLSWAYEYGFRVGGLTYRFEGLNVRAVY